MRTINVITTFNQTGDTHMNTKYTSVGWFFRTLFLGLLLALAAPVMAQKARIITLETPITAQEARATAQFRAQFDTMGLKNALIIAGAEVDNNFALAARNIPNVDVLPNAGLNVYDVLRRHTLVLTKDAVDAISARFAEKEAA